MRRLRASAIDGRWIDLIYRERGNNVASILHGVDHWRRVACNGVELCQKIAFADFEVVWHFAYAHDVMRQNEDHDPEHGPRAVEFIKEHRSALSLTNRQVDMLCAACAGHTHALPFKGKTKKTTLQVCWDADRLDMPRVGVPVDTKYLFTDAAKALAGPTNKGERCWL